MFLHIRLSIQLLLCLVLLPQKRLFTAAGSLPHMKNAQQSQQQQVAHAQNLHQQLSPQTHVPQQVQYVHEKETLQENNMKTTEEELNDPYQLLNELKHEPQLPSTPTPFNWNPFNQQNAPTHIPHSAQHFENYPPPPATAKFLPFFSYPQPVFIPFPLFIAPEMFYPAPFSGASNDMDESMSRARRPSAASGHNSAYQRNSPIYYVRLPPTPYMFFPNLGYPSAPSPSAAFGTGYSPLLSMHNSLPTFSAFSQVYNLPMNFLANGKPTNIYQMGGTPSDIQNSLQYGGLNFGMRPPPPPQNPYRPLGPSNGYMAQPPFGLAAAQQQDSKMTALKRPFLFNGRPEDIYILQNNYNPLYSDPGYY